jgi:hypothetical protein
MCEISKSERERERERDLGFQETCLTLAGLMMELEVPG